MPQDVHHLIIIPEYECSKDSFLTTLSANLAFKSKFVWICWWTEIFNTERLSFVSALCLPIKALCPLTADWAGLWHHPSLSSEYWSLHHTSTSHNTFWGHRGSANSQWTRAAAEAALCKVVIVELGLYALLLSQRHSGLHKAA